MVTTNDDLPEFPNGISTSPKKAKLGGVSLQPCRISAVVVQFPEELVYEIFLRLPVKSLIRFRCVSKGTRRLIDSPIFIKNHNNIHRSSSSSVIVERDRSLSVSLDESYDNNEDDYAIVIYQPCLRRLFSVNFDNNLNLNRAKTIELNSNFAQEGKMEVLGWCCNGIFCFRNSRLRLESYVLWNPSNGTFRKTDCSACLLSYQASMGYDCVNDDYKIIRFLAAGGDYKNLEIYSFRKDSWRKIAISNRGRNFSLHRYCYTSEVCLGGVIHWLWTDRTDRSMSIAAFDLATETFTSLPLPSEARRLELEPSHFTDFRGRLCVTFLPAGYPRHSHGPQTIWVMDKYGVDSSWSKLYDFDITSCRVYNFYFPNMKRRLLCDSGRSGRLSWWDPRDGSIKDIEIPGLLNDQARIPELYFYDAYVYVRNLLRLDRTRSGQAV